MKLARSTYYDEPELQPLGEARLVEQIKAVCAEWPAYGYRRDCRLEQLPTSPGKKSRSGLQSACDELIDKGAIITGE